MSNKEKLLESAQKFIAKGQLPRAIKDYQKVVELDPKDVRSRQKLAELLSRARMIPEAIDAFEGVAKYYADNGFYLKAIAVYKQVQRLDPARSAIYLRLAELNEKQGLIGNALAEYRTLVGYYEKNRMIPEAIHVLLKMRDMEPENLNIRVKIIETYLLAGSSDSAQGEFADTAGLLEPKRDFARLQKIYEYFLPRFPNHLQMKIGYARVLIRKGEAPRGIETLKEVLSSRPEDEGVLRLLAEGYRENKDYGQERRVFERMLLNRPDDLELRSGLIRARLDGGEFSQALDDLETGQDAFRCGGRISVLKGFYERLSRELPGEERVNRTLRSIYETTGEGGKLFDVMAAGSGAGTQEALEDAEVLPEELFTDSVLEEAIGDIQGTEEEDAPPAVFAEEEIDDHAEEIPLEFLEGMDLKSSSAPTEAPPVESPPELELELELELDLEFDLPHPEKTPAAESGLPFREAEISVPVDPAFFDLRAALDVGGEKPDANPVPESAVEIGEESAPQAKKGIKTDVDVEDPESHYNLGIAYKEMGLLDDAVKEFEKALAEPSLAVASLTLKGICLIEKGLLPRAEETFKAGLDRPGLNDGERMGLFYELGLLYEGWDRPGEASEFFQKVAAVDPFHRDAGEKVRTLRHRLEQDGTHDGEDRPSRKDRVSYV